ncbi:Concanavalin A-like lectin/glucanase, subgroup [Cynara cardunculus var. scolymus]|uniref:Concanavalin A-like lectin/glucanase, subgroup n=2 Tax=Cynara cardunculus var. scolymus TaxID=59895 RepID=A0A103Y721_CYNCS|nr:Concanavalin A-like lectin/glucanase, subgroup [Cynara cardunculus var. scolymus]
MGMEVCCEKAVKKTMEMEVRCEENDGDGEQDSPFSEQNAYINLKITDVPHYQVITCEYFPMKLCSHQVLQSIIVILSLVSPVFADLNSDKLALLAFADAIPHGSKLNWSNATSICSSWLGIVCASDGTGVSGVRLPAVGLTGPIPSNTLGKLEKLEVLSLRLNHLNGKLPSDLLSLPSLHHLFLQQNNFTSNIPASFPPNMSVLDLSFNSFSGNIPETIQNLTQLTRLNLQNNSLSGSIPNITFSRLKYLNISYNDLNGRIPSSFQSFPNSSFMGNSFLCGLPLNPCSPILPPPPPPPNPTPRPSSPAPSVGPQQKNSKKLPLWAIIAIAVGGVALILLVIIIFFCCLKKKRRNTSSVRKGKSSSIGGRGEEPREEFGGEVQEPENNKMVFFEGCSYNFDLEDLLRASAEVLAKGSFGTAYKATLEESVTVVVKRLKDVVVGKKEFEQQMEMIGRVEPHPNVVPLRAYYYSKDEKLLVYDYISRGSLLTLLHGNRGADRALVDWETRVKIALGAARGIAHIHAFGGPKFIHGNIKSSNVLINQDGEGCISDIGLAPLVNFPPTTSRYTVGYRAPEVLDNRKHTHKSDVYSFGVLLLEMLTGKKPLQSPGREDMVDLPKWVQSVVREEWTAEVFDIELMKFQNIEEEMVQMLQIGMACVVLAADMRPTIDEVVKMIEEIRLSDSENRRSSDEIKPKGANGRTP